MADEAARVRISRRKFIGGAAAAAVVTAGGASAAVVLHREGGRQAGAIDANSFAPTPAASRALEDPDVRLRHLLRRTTFAVLPADVQRYRGKPLDAVVDDLLASAGGDDSATDAKLAAYGLDLTKPADIVSWWLARMALTERPLLEKMTLFWHGLLTSGFEKTGAKRARLLLDQNAFFRAHAFDRFDVLLKGVVRDPAMMLWLDLQTSRAGHPNENYARELMELFTLGDGNYTEQDVRESARAHTGYSLTRDATFVFRPALHDNGEKTFLGETGNFDADAIVDILLRQAPAPAHFARRLFAFFAYPDPDDATLAPIAAVVKSSGFDAKAIVRAVLTSDAFYAPQAYRAIVKSPTDYVVGVARSIGVKSDGRALAGASRNMGQVLFDPPNVAGWPGGDAWIGTSTWFARVNFAAALANGSAAGRRRQQADIPDVVGLFDPPPASSSDAVARIGALLLDGQMADASKEALVGYLDDGGAFASLTDARRDERLRGLVALVLASPEYQLA